MKSLIISISIVTLLLAGMASYRFLKDETRDTDRIVKSATTLRDLGTTWLYKNINAKGLFTYNINPVTGENPGKNNELRQLMASRILAENSHTNEAVLELHKKNLDFILRYWYRTDTAGKGHVLYNGKSKLGGNAMLLRTLLASPLKDDYRVQIDALKNGILSLQNPDGSFEPWFEVPADYEYDKDYLLTFYSGEALLALVEYYESYPQPDLLKTIELSASHYIDAYVTHLDENYYPAYVPWHTLAYNHLYKITRDQKYADAIFILNDTLLKILDTEGTPGRFYNPHTPEYGSPHASSDAVYTEGLAYAYEIAKMTGDELHMHAYEKALWLALQNLESLQYRTPIHDAKSDSDAYIGALRVNKDSNWIRTDTTQHMVDATTKLIELFSE